jgi:hypothetical protein
MGKERSAGEVLELGSLDEDPVAAVDDPLGRHGPMGAAAIADAMPGGVVLLGPDHGLATVRTRKDGGDPRGEASDGVAVGNREVGGYLDNGPVAVVRHPGFSLDDAGVIHMRPRHAAVVQG